MCSKVSQTVSILNMVRCYAGCFGIINNTAALSLVLVELAKVLVKSLQSLAMFKVSLRRVQSIFVISAQCSEEVELTTHIFLNDCQISEPAKIWDVEKYV